MRKFLLVTALLAASLPCHGVVSCFAHTTSAGAANSAAIDTTGATILIMVLNGASSVQGVIDSAGNSWTFGTVFGSGVPKSSIGYVKAPLTSATHTFHINGTATPVATYYACSGTATTGGFAAQTGLANAGSGTFQPGSVGYTAGDLVVTGVTSNDGAATASINSSFQTPVGNGADGANEPGWGSVLVTTTGTSVNPTWTMSTGTDWSAVIVVFAQAAVPTMVKRGGAASWH